MKLSETGKPILMAEDSPENTFSCVPKVQGESRISQANGRRTAYPLILSSLPGLLIFCILF